MHAVSLQKVPLGKGIYIIDILYELSEINRNHNIAHLILQGIHVQNKLLAYSNCLIGKYLYQRISFTVTS